MGKIKINANFFRANVNTTDKLSCLTQGLTCNDTSALLLDYLFFCGSNVSSFYNGPKCGHGKPSGGEALVAYLLDNYYEPALKFSDTGASLIAMLQGSIAMIYVERQAGLCGLLDVWNGHRLLFEKNDTLQQLRAKRVWVWAMGEASHAKIKSHSHHTKHRAHVNIF
jgi:hypothetical protein